MSGRVTLRSLPAEPQLAARARRSWKSGCWHVPRLSSGWKWERQKGARDGRSVEVVSFSVADANGGDVLQTQIVPTQPPKTKSLSVSRKEDWVLLRPMGLCRRAAAGGGQSLRCPCSAIAQRSEALWHQLIQLRAHSPPMRALPEDATAVIASCKAVATGLHRRR